MEEPEPWLVMLIVVFKLVTLYRPGSSPTSSPPEILELGETHEKAAGVPFVLDTSLGTQSLQI